MRVLVPSLEFNHIRVEDLLLDGGLPQIHITHAKRGADRYVPILPALADELRTHLQALQKHSCHRWQSRAGADRSISRLLACTAALSQPPHSPQNLVTGALSNPRFAQRTIDLSGVPQRLQNFSPLGFSGPQ